MIFAEQSAPDMLPDTGVDTQKLEAFAYRYHPSTDTYLAIRNERLIVYAPSQSSEMIDYGGISQFLPDARAENCGL